MGAVMDRESMRYGGILESRCGVWIRSVAAEKSRRECSETESMSN